MKHQQHKSAFSLIEVLVSVALLSLLIALLSGVLDKTAEVTGRTTRVLNVGSKGEEVLSTIGQDLDRIVLDGGGALLVTENASSRPWGGALCCVVPGRPTQGEPEGRYQTVAYWIAEQDQAPVLRRQNRNVDWSNANRSLLEQALGNATNALRPTFPTANGAPELVATEVVRMVFRVLDSNGNRLSLRDVTSDPNFPNELLASPDWKALSLESATGITVTVALLDPTIRTTFSDHMEALAQALPDSGLEQSPMETWEQAIQSGNLAHLPSPILESLRFYERTYLLK